MGSVRWMQDRRGVTVVKHWSNSNCGDRSCWIPRLTCCRVCALENEARRGARNLAPCWDRRFCNRDCADPHPGAPHRRMVRQVLTVSPTPYLSPLPDTLYYCGEPIKLELTGGIDQNYVWNNGSNSNSITITSPGLYSVVATQACGILKDSTYIKDMALEIPNLVTQNGDAMNGCRDSALHSHC